MEDAEHRASSVPPELRGREVSARLLTPFFAAAKKKRIQPEVFAQGTGYPLSHLQNRRERISWEAFMTFIENMSAHFDDDALIALGAAVLDSPAHRAILLPGRLLFTLPDIFRWGVSPEGPLAQQLAAQDMTFTQVDERTIRLDTILKPGYRAVRGFWLLRLGFLRSISRAFGLPLSKVTMTTTEHGASHEITLPKDRGVARRIRTKASWLFAARDAAIELRKANDDLHTRYIQLQREVEARVDAEEKLRTLNAELEVRIAERTNQLERANRDLGLANAELTLFSASVAHDLRAPLRAINGFSNAILEDHGEKLDPEMRKLLARVIEGGTRMDFLIDSLFALARITRTEVKREKIDLGEVTHGIIEDMRAIDPSRSVELVVGGGGQPLAVEGDPALVRALMQNLLGNAWKFTRGRPSARIEVQLTETSPVDVFSVRDNGVGFDMKHAGALFSPFQRLHSAREFEGSGIGLATVERIIRRHGGRIWAEAAPDQGATFSFTLRAR